LTKSIIRKGAAVVFTAAMMLAIFSGAFSGVTRFILLLFTALVGVPLCWLMLRGEKASGREHTYRDPTAKPTPTERFGEFKVEGPGAEAGIYGPTRSSDRFYTGLMINREWLHPDILWYRKLLNRMRKEKEASTKGSQ
jgi:hypothetical protein